MLTGVVLLDVIGTAGTLRLLVGLAGIFLAAVVGRAPAHARSIAALAAVVVLGVSLRAAPVRDYDLAHYAYDIERKDLGLSGGKQDQYAATFGGVNFMEFYEQDKVIVNPLRIKSEFLHELENNLVLYFTASSRDSATIIDEQVKNVKDKNESSIAAMHQLKEQARMMKEALLKGRLNEIGEILDYGFEQKRKMAANISNSNIENIYEAAKKSGASGGKISGAGGGGFMIFYCPGNSRHAVIKTLNTFAHTHRHKHRHRHRHRHRQRQRHSILATISCLPRTKR